MNILEALKPTGKIMEGEEDSTYLASDGWWYQKRDGANCGTTLLTSAQVFYRGWLPYHDSDCQCGDKGCVNVEKCICEEIRKKLNCPVHGLSKRAALGLSKHPTPSPCLYCELEERLIEEVTKYGGESALDYEIKHTLLSDSPDHTCKKGEER